MVAIHSFIKMFIKIEKMNFNALQNNAQNFFYVCKMVTALFDLILHIFVFLIWHQSAFDFKIEQAAYALL